MNEYARLAEKLRAKPRFLCLRFSLSQPCFSQKSRRRRGPDTLRTIVHDKKPNQMKIKTLSSVLAAVALSLGSTFAATTDGWSTDFEASVKLAAAEKKDLLVEFTGSDWCQPCMMLNKEILSQDIFRDGTKETFVKVQLDFPRAETLQTPEVRKRNVELRTAYRISGYPTIMLCDSAGLPYAVTGYQPGGPEKYVEHLTGLREARGKRDAAFAAAEKAEGVARAKILVAALEDMKLPEQMVTAQYGDVAAKIKAADPADETGYSKKAADTAKLSAFLEKLGEFGQKQDVEGALAYVDTVLADKELGVETRQHVYGHKAGTLMRANRPAEAAAVLDEGVKVAPDSRIAPQLAEFAELARKRAAEPAAEAPKPAGK